MVDILVYFYFLDFFIPSCRVRFSSDKISLWPTEFLFAFHVVQVCWRQILPALVCLKISLFHFVFEGYIHWI